MAINISSEEVRRLWGIQKNGKWKTFVIPFKKSAAVHYHFNKFIKFFYWDFRQRKNISNNYYPEIEFLGFKEFDDHKSKAGHCLFESEFSSNNNIIKGELSIYLNQWFLLSKLNINYLITSEPVNVKEYYEVSFKKLIGTIAHELAHAYQNTVNNFAPNEKRSQCESSGEGKRELIVNKKKGKKINKLIRPKYPELVNEHTKLTKEIKEIIKKSPEYQNLKTWWTTDKFPHQDRQNNIKKCENCRRDSQVNPCQECIEEREFQRISLLIQKSKDLTNLEKNYQEAKGNTIYNEFDKKIGIDNLYHETKIYLSDVQKQNDELKKIIGISLLLVGVILIFGLIVRILPRRKRKKY